jgi:hypothetical protein
MVNEPEVPTGRGLNARFLRCCLGLRSEAQVKLHYGSAIGATLHLHLSECVRWTVWLAHFALPEHVNVLMGILHAAIQIVTVAP